MNKLETNKKEAEFRHELKYICSNAELRMLQSRFKGIMQLDVHAGSKGSYMIRSMYFDDVYHTSFWENEDGINLREKWRIRIYNNSKERITLECKSKASDMISKKSCQITLEQFNSLAYDEGHCDISRENPDLLNRFIILKRTKHMKPTVIVQYERCPYVYKNGNVRVTFDQNIVSSKAFGLFFESNIPCRPIMPMGHGLLEVKYDEYLPDHIYHAVQMRDMQRTRFSKYYLCRQYSL